MAKRISQEQLRNLVRGEGCAQCGGAPVGILEGSHKRTGERVEMLHCEDERCLAALRRVMRSLTLSRMGELYARAIEARK